MNSFIQKRIWLVVTVFAIFFILPSTTQAIGWLDGLTSFDGLMQEAIRSFLGLAQSGLSTIASWIAQLLKPDGILYTVPDGVYQVWVNLRNFINLFFVLVIIMMAFGTIFDVSGYSFGELFPKFLISALLINFSFVIGKYIFDLSNQLSIVFINTISATEGAGFADQVGKLAQVPIISGSSPDHWEALVGQAFGSGSTTLILLVAMILMFGIFVSFLIIFTVILIRIPIMWFILVLSPLAWLGYMLPSIKSATWSRWWRALFAWSFFLPVYIFFLMFGLLMFQQQPEPTPDNGLNLLVYYILAMMIMVFGMRIAYSSATKMNSGVGALLKGVQGRVRRLPGIRYPFLRAEAYKSVGKEIAQHGLPGSLRGVYGGEDAYKRALETQKAKSLKRFGYSAGLEGAEEYKRQANNEYNILDERWTLGQLSPDEIKTGVDKYSNPNDPRYLAYRNMMAESKSLDEGGETLKNTMQALQNNPYALNEFVKKAKENQFGKVDKKVLVNLIAGEGENSFITDPKYSLARRHMVDGLKDDKFALSLGDLTKEKYKKIMDEVYGDGEYTGGNNMASREFAQEVSRMHPGMAADYSAFVANKKALEDGDTAKIFADNKGRVTNEGTYRSTRLEKMRQFGLSAKDIANADAKTWKTDNEFKALINERLSKLPTVRQRANAYDGLLREIDVSRFGVEDKTRELKEIYKNLPDVEKGKKDSKFDEIDSDIFEKGRVPGK